MEVAAAAVPLIKFKRRKVSAVRRFPKGCGPRPPTHPSPAAKPTDALPLDLPNGLTTPAPTKATAVDDPVTPLTPAKPDPGEGAAKSNDAVPEGLVELSVKSEAAELSKEGSDLADLPKPDPGEGAAKSKDAVPQGLVELSVKSEAAELSKEGSDLADLPNGSSDQPELPNGGLDQLELQQESSDRPEEAVVATREVIAINPYYSSSYPPPKRRKVSAMRKYPAGCGRSATFTLRDESWEAPCLKRKTVVAEEENALDQQLEADGSVEVKDTERDETKVAVVETKESRDVLEDDGNVRVKAKVPSDAIESKSSDKKDVDRQLTLPEGSNRVVSSGKSRGEARRDDVKQTREKDKEIRSEPRVNFASKSNLGENIAGESIGEKILVRSGLEKQPEMRDVKEGRKSLPIKATRERNPSPDSRSQSGSKLMVKTGSSSAGKPLGKEVVKHPADAKFTKRKFAEEVQNRGSVANDQREGGEALEVLGDRIIVQALMAAPNCPWRQGKKFSGITNRSVTPKTIKKEGKSSSMNSAFKGASVTRSKNEVDSEDKKDSRPPDEDNKMALTLYKKPQELSITLTPLVPSKSSDDEDVSDRNRVKRALRLYQLLSRKLLQGEESKSKDLGRINRVDLKAAATLKEHNEWVNAGKPILGHVPGVEVGDEFHWRVELSIVGLHRPFQGGIDYMKKDGMILATSIVASGGYDDDVDSSDVLVYSGSGGNPAGGDKQAGDQKLERGNLALKNSIDAKTPVRVIHGSKELKGSDHDTRPKAVSTFTYSGLYVVENYWTEKGPHGFNVFKFQLRRMAGQPELAVKEVKRSKKGKVREGLCIKDISEGKENMPICAVNTIDDDRPMPFMYISENIYPSYYKHIPPSGCDCTNGCSDSETCACAVKNGGDIPFNFNGSIVQAKPLVYECGPSCKCPPSCYNRVSQHGIRIPLEIFKTKSRGWGVRSLYSIPSGSFICEYIGELLEDSEAEQRNNNDEYLFDIGHNYEDKTLWEGLPSFIPGLQSNALCDAVEDVGFTIDAAEYGNIGRFINHSCSPNTYAQNVLYDHDDKRMPHIMFFAADNIPPLQELTYHYNYTVDQVRDSEGNIKRKNCYCGAPECTGRLY